MVQVISIHHSNYAILTREAEQVVEGKNGLNPEIDYTGPNQYQSILLFTLQDAAATVRRYVRLVSVPEEKQRLLAVLSALV